MILIYGQNAGHMGMQKGLPGVIPDKGEGEADEIFPIESAQNLPAGMLGNHENCGWDGDLLAPNGALEFDTLVEFGESFAMANFYLRRS